MRHLSIAVIGAVALASCGEAPEAAPETETTEPAAVDPVAEVENVLPEQMAEMVTQEFSDFGTVNYRAGIADLDGDGTDEWLVFVSGPGICGSGGCPLRIFRDGDDGPMPIGNLSVTQLPIGVFESETDGWRDLAVTVGGGGIEYSLAKVPWNGEAYASNPTVDPATPSEDEFETVISLPDVE